MTCDPFYSSIPDLTWEPFCSVIPDLTWESFCSVIPDLIRDPIPRQLWAPLGNFRSLLTPLL